MGVYVGDKLVAGNVGEVYSKAQVDAMIANAVALAEPTGSIKPFAGTTIPDGYLLCDGSAVSRTTYAALFAVIGTTYGTGDGSTTFNLPNLTDAVPWYDTNIVYSVGELQYGDIPNITGSLTGSNSAGTNNRLLPFRNLAGAFTVGSASYNDVIGASTGSGTSSIGKLTFDASRVSSIYKSVTGVKPKRLYVGGYVIKY